MIYHFAGDLLDQLLANPSFETPKIAPDYIDYAIITIIEPENSSIFQRVCVLAG